MDSQLVDFDLDVGPKICSMYPPLDLSHTEADNVAFSSFPDCPQFEQGSQVHSFRIRARQPSEDKLVRPSDQRPHTVDGFIYGYSHFTQRRDATSKRGYQQRSVVILTHLAYPALFHTLVSKLGPAFLMHGSPMLEAACHNVASWSDPSPGHVVELEFLGTVFQTELPLHVDTQQAPSTKPPPTPLNGSCEAPCQILASLPPSEPPALLLFEACLPQLWSIWECLVLCEPILVYGPSPAMTSQAVWWLRDILRPIPVAGDFRPFFTIHDADHTALVNPRPPSAGLLLGVTNPYFEGACKHWPHVLSLGRTPPTKSKAHVAASPGPLPGWKSRMHKRYVARDHALLEQLKAACTGSEQAKREASAALRQHFSSRTAALLVPLQRYLQTLIPSPASVASATFPSTPYSKSASVSAFPNSSSSSLFPLRSSVASSFSYHSAASSGTLVPSPLSTTATTGLATWNAPEHASAEDKEGNASQLTISVPPHDEPIPESHPSIFVSSVSTTTPSSSTISSPPSSAASSSTRAPTPTPTSADPRLAPFNERAFLASLKPLALPFKSAGKAREFYARWIRTPAFGVWIARQEETVERVLRGERG
ncbi:DUF1630-domain-containing protein [Laetiporus sulphureus 93-53]|uniref:DUF1630-domain-containing protein n=1 Tax=Laetiporus sulphureus 93-53 TaxID=1314785 RepID=A0A165ESH0_9APHY|nr:DUF1630-domain-containing protein [Laetiporus sulphureus 93-53]KZT07668.1 DUF1630-domain-containing protein [Laetiporus sulphureus 93-53]